MGYAMDTILQITEEGMVVAYPAVGRRRQGKINTRSREVTHRMNTRLAVNPSLFAGPSPAALPSASRKQGL